MGLSDREGGAVDTVAQHARQAWSDRSFRFPLNQDS
jgi:hypothetical protein